MDKIFDMIAEVEKRNRNAREHLKSVRKKSLEIMQKLNESEMSEAELAMFTDIINRIADIDELAEGIIKDLEAENEK